MNRWNSSECPLFKALLANMATPERLNRIKTDNPDEYYEPQVLEQHTRLSKLISELRHQVKMLRTIDSFVAVRSHIKLYIITWHTLSDVVANLVNKVYKLGIADKDVHLTMVLRNSHIAATELPKLLQKHQSAVRYSEFSRLRNDIIHRGVLRDERLDEIYGTANSLTLRDDPRFQAFRIPTAPAPTAHEFSENESALQTYLKNKIDELSAHLTATEDMLIDFMSELAKDAPHKANS